MARRDLSVGPDDDLAKVHRQRTTYILHVPEKWLDTKTVRARITVDIVLRVTRNIRK